MLRDVQVTQAGERPEITAADDHRSVEFDALSIENRMLHAVLDHFPGGLLLYDHNLRLVLCNDRQKEMLEYPPALFEYGLPSLEQIYRFNAVRGEYGPGNVEVHVRERMRLAALREPHLFERVRPNGMVLQIRGVPLPGGGFLTTYLDVTREKVSLSVQAPRGPHVDPVSELPLWALFLERFEQVMSRVRRGQIAAMHFVGLDNFKDLESQLGAKACEAIVKEVALRLHGAVRGTDMVTRYGAGEFVVLQAEVDRPSSVARLSNRLVDAIRRPLESSSGPLSIGASLGVAMIPRDGVAAEELVAAARGNLLRSRGEAKPHVAGLDAGI